MTNVNTPIMLSCTCSARAGLGNQSSVSISSSIGRQRAAVKSGEGLELQGHVNKKYFQYCRRRTY